MNAPERRDAPSLRTLAMPADTNPNGDIFGGWILAQMDLAGGTYAWHIARGRVATVAITGMKFLKPVYVGDEVSVYCNTHRIGNTSIAVNVEAWVRRGTSRLGSVTGSNNNRSADPDNVEERVTEGLFTFVAIDENGKSRPVSKSTA